jgi:hypothetical protein
MRLTNVLLNTNSIHKIIISPDKYHIHIIGFTEEGSKSEIFSRGDFGASNENMNKQVDGVLWIFGGFGIGNVSSNLAVIEVCRATHSTDYEIVAKWIDKN